MATSTRVVPLYVARKRSRSDAKIAAATSGWQPIWEATICGTSFTKYDDDDVRSFFHMFVKETSIIKYDDDDDYRSSFHRYVKETSIDMMMMMIEVSYTGR